MIFLGLKKSMGEKVHNQSQNMLVVFLSPNYHEHKPLPSYLDAEGPPCAPSVPPKCGGMMQLVI